MSETTADATEPTATEPVAPAPVSPTLPAASFTDGLGPTNAPKSKATTLSAATSESSLASSSAKPSGIKPPAPRIGRACCSHGTPKAGPPPLVAEQHSDPAAMRRQQSDEHSRSHLADVFEESEADLVVDCTDRSTKSRSPSVGIGSQGHRTHDRKESSGSMGSENYLEATGKRRNSDQNVVLTADTDSFIIGQRIWVGGHRPGHIAYIGETNFAPGDWAGIVLDDASGKNDGCVSGKRYFQCEPKRGIFSRLFRLTREPLATSSSGDVSMIASSHMSSMASPGRSGRTSPTQSMRSYATGVGKTPSKGNLAIGDRVIVSSGMGSRPGILKYIGETHFASGNWCGVQLDEPSGKNDGSIDNERYFECPPNYGVFVPLAKVSLSPSSRKVRLSRAGSKESLTSVGTIGSMASTVTSRMRLSGAQQDILREKQNHIEQLMQERDLEKQDAGNQILSYQTSISQLKDQIEQLERRLASESKRTEELQASVEEATFCGDELTAQTQDYRERIAALESQLAAQQSGTAAAESEAQHNELRKLADEVATKSAALLSTEAELKQRLDELSALSETLKATESDFDIKLSSLALSEQCLREEITFFQSENEQLKTELRSKDESTEKEYLSMKHIEHEMREEMVSLQQQLKMHEASQASNDGELQRLLKKSEGVIAELRTAAKGAAEVHDLELSRKLSEIEALKATLGESNKTIEDLTNERSHKAEEAQKQQLTIAQHQNTIEETSALVVKLQNQAIVHAESIELANVQISEQIQSLTASESTVKTLRDENSAWTIKFQELQTSNQSLNEIMNKEKDEVIEGLNRSIAQLTESLNAIAETKSSLVAEVASKDQQIEEHGALIDELQGNVKKVNAINTSLLNELTNFKDSLENKDQIFGKLSEEVTFLTNNLAERTKEIECLKAKSLTNDEQIRRMGVHNVELTAELEKLRTAGDNDASQIVDLKQTIVQFDQTTKEHVSTFEVLTKELTELKDQLEQLKIDKSNIQQNLSEQTIALEQSQTNVIAKSQEVSSSLQEISKLQEQVVTNDAELEKSQKQLIEFVEKLSASIEEASKTKEALSGLEVEHADLKRQMAILESKVEESNQQKTSLQQNLDALQCSSLDTNSEIKRLTDELNSQRNAHSDMVDKSNATQLTLERKLHEQTQNLAARTTQWERVKEEMETLTTQKIDRENELNLELAKIKEASEADRETLVSNLEAMQASFKAEKEAFATRMANTLAESNATISALKENIDQLNLEKEANSKDYDDNIRKMVEAQAALQNQLEGAQQSQESLRNSLENSEKSGASEYASLDARFKESEEKAADLNAQVNGLNTTLTDLSCQLKASELRSQEVSLSYESLVQTTKDESVKSEAKIKELNAKVVELTEQFQITEDDQVDLVNKNLELVDQITLLRQQISESEELKVISDEQFITLQSQLEATNTLFDEFKTVVKDNVNLIAELEKKVEDKTLTIDELNVKLADQVQSMESVQQSLSKTQEHVVSLKSSSESTHQLTNSQLQSALAELDAKQSHIQSLEEKISHLMSAVNLSDDLKTELTVKSDELRSKDTSIVTLNTELEHLRQLQAASSAELIQVRQHLETQRISAETAHKSHVAEVSRLQDKIESLERGMQAQVTEVTGDKNRLASECDALNALIAKQKQEFQERMQQYEERSKFEALREELAMVEAAKQKELDELAQRLLQSETTLAGQTASIQRLDAIQRSEKDLQYEKVALERKEQQLQLENRQLNERIERMNAAKAANAPAAAAAIHSDDDSVGQIAFLNSIIADMQKKNETLMVRIGALESAPQDFMNNGLFDVPMRREPAPRMFCDICDVFDAHETEDCPLQSSDSSPPPPQAIVAPSVATNGAKKERKVPPPRKYCDLCESFGHEAAECDADETY